MSSRARLHAWFWCSRGCAAGAVAAEAGSAAAHSSARRFHCPAQSQPNNPSSCTLVTCACRYELELIDFEPPEDTEQVAGMLFEQRLEAAERRRIDGNELFKEGRLDAALSKYRWAGGRVGGWAACCSAGKGCCYCYVCGGKEGLPKYHGASTHLHFPLLLRAAGWRCPSSTKTCSCSWTISTCSRRRRCAVPRCSTLRPRSCARWACLFEQLPALVLAEMRSAGCGTATSCPPQGVSKPATAA